MAKSTKKPAPVKKPKLTGVDKPRSKGQVFSTIAEQTELSRKQVAAVFDAMTEMLKMDLKKPGIFQVPGLMKVSVIRKPATKARMAPNPFKPGEMMQVKAKPARNVVKVRALKGLKALV
ncbi:MAG: HU family DNA-binding protein [Phycisphaerales bacterium]